MENRAAKLANARKKLRDHQEKKSVYLLKDEASDSFLSCGTPTDISDINKTTISMDEACLLNSHTNLSKPDREIEQFNYYGCDHEAPVETIEKSYANVTEILISNKTDLEMQIKELQLKNLHLENILSKEVAEHNLKKQKLVASECELNEVNKKQSLFIESLSTQESLINELRNQLKVLTDENNNMLEQQEFTKTMLTAKEMEVAQLQNHVYALQSQVDVKTLQLQQLTSDTNITLNQEPGVNHETVLLKEKIALLEHELENSLKEKDHINSHYEHYMNRLNEQIKNQATKNEALSSEVKNLSNRESALIEQIGQLEIRMQSYRSQSEAYAESHRNSYKQELQDKVISLQVGTMLHYTNPDSHISRNMENCFHQAGKAELDELNNKHNYLQKQYEKCIFTIEELNKAQAAHDNMSVIKLSADIASDKIAAQRATEQNKKLKADVEGLEQIVIKLGKDKLELTEKLSHENQLNKQLMLKLAEVDEISKQMQTKVMAKDEEMIRLQASLRDVENKHKQLLENLLKTKEDAVSAQNDSNIVALKLHTNGVQTEVTSLVSKGNSAVNAPDEKISAKILKEDAMHKLQERFLNIMDQVANLSDEKHRLEHIILQLQTETDTICEYVALYQQQRSLLKKRDEERSAQIKLFQMECDEVKRQLEELSSYFLKLAQDKDLYPLLQLDVRQNDIAKIKTLLENLLNSSLINSKCKNLELKNFYPCSCCSGQLIDV